MAHRSYAYVGPKEIFDIAMTQPSGIEIGSIEDLKDWLGTDPTEIRPDGSTVATFTIGNDFKLRLAPRRSEHVACASGGPVFAAGEITISDDFEITEITNQSTGFCPEPDCWAIVAKTLDQLQLKRPNDFTTSIIFRLCPKCNQRNIVKDSWYQCDTCNSELPEQWNFAGSSNAE